MNFNYVIPFHVRMMHVILDFQNSQRWPTGGHFPNYGKCLITPLICELEGWFVLTSCSRNPLVILVLTYDLSFKVICDFEDQTYTNHAISPLLLPVEIQYVLPSYRKSLSRNPLIVLVFTYDLSFKVIG